MKQEGILSQDEIDALMDTFSKKTPGAEPSSEVEPTTEPELRPSASPQFPIPNSEFRIPIESRSESQNEIEYRDVSLSRINDNWEQVKGQYEKRSEVFGYSLISSLSNVLMNDIVLKNFVVEPPIAYADFVASLNSPSCIGMFTSETPSITVLLELGLDLGYSILDIAMGGKGDSSLKIQRALTDLEMKLIAKPMERIMNNLDKALELNVPLELQEVFTYPSQISLDPFHQTVVIPYTFNLMAEESTMEEEATLSKLTYTVTFCISRTTIELQISNQNTIGTDDKEKGKYLEAIKNSPLIDVPLRIQANSPAVEVTIGKLMEMKVGETLLLGTHQDDNTIEVDLLVEGCPKFRGTLGAIGQYKAVEII